MATTPASGSKSQEVVPTDPDLIEDMREFRAWKEAKAEAAEAGSAVGPQAKLLEVAFPGESEPRLYRLVDVDRDVVAHLSMLTTLAETELDKAQALFEAMLTPEDYVALRRDVKMCARELRRRQAAGEDVMSIEELWRALIDTVAEPLREMSADPKRAALLRGPSPTGPSSKTGSTPEALPSTT